MMWDPTLLAKLCGRFGHPIIVAIDSSSTYHPVLEEILGKEVLGPSWRDEIHREAFHLSRQCVSALLRRFPVQTLRASEGDVLQDGRVVSCGHQGSGVAMRLGHDNHCATGELGTRHKRSNDGYWYSGRPSRARARREAHGSYLL
jgi:hypothetical protein